MGLRGFLFQRTWVPPRIFRSEAEENEARDRARMRKNERLYNWTRYLVAVAVVLVLIAVFATIVSFYVHRIGDERVEHFEPFANIQPIAQIGDNDHVSLAGTGTVATEAKSRPTRWDPFISGRSYSNRGHPRNKPVGSGRYSDKDRTEIRGRSESYDPQPYGSPQPQIQYRDHYDNRGGLYPSNTGAGSYPNSGKDTFYYPHPSYGGQMNYPTTQSIAMSAYGYTPAPSYSQQQPYGYPGQIGAQPNYGYSPASAVEPGNYGYAPPSMGQSQGYGYAQPIAGQSQSYGYSPPGQYPNYGPVPPPYSVPQSYGPPPASTQNYGYAPAPAVYPVTIPPWQAYQDSIVQTSTPPPAPETTAVATYIPPDQPAQYEHSHDHDHDHDHHSPVSPSTQTNGGTYIAEIIPTQKDEDEDLTHRHSDDDHDHEHSEYNTVNCAFKCVKDGACIPESQRCDGRVHCPDASDEHDCDCKARIGAKKLCDGIMDCPYGEDEDQCYGCNETQFSCRDPYDNDIKAQQASICIDRKKNCDGTADCPNARDEKHCFRLGAVGNQERGLIAEGLLQKMIGGTWYFICKRSESDDTIAAVAAKTCRMLVGDLGDENPEVSSVPGTSSEYSGLNYAFIGDTDAEFEVAGTQCPGKRLIKVKCPDPMCGYPVSKYESHTYGGLKPGGEENERYRRNRYSHDDMIQGKVVGGYDSHPGDWPFLVAIYRNGAFHCGASLIHPEWILTAAHCTHGFEKYVFEAQVGQMRRYSWSPYEQSRHIKEIHVHHRYDNHVFMNDIALMKLDRPVYLSKWVTTACLSHEKSMDPEIDEMCNVIGWGDLAEDGSAPDHMQEVSLPVKNCKETFTRDSMQMCAGYEEGGKDACQGDSGGPFVCKDYDGRLIVAGLVSFGRGCARAGQLGVYTRISAYRSWIDSILSGQNEAYQQGNYYPKFCESSTCYRSGGECLFDKMRCDQNIDCLYGDDEVDCNYTTTTYVPETYHVDSHALEEVREASHGHEEHTHGDAGMKLCHETKEFQCRVSKGCVPISKRCDGRFDCSDYTDEKDCDCLTILQNTHPNNTCDGVPHCEEDLDESECDYCDGEEYSVLCSLSGGTCVPKNRWCDGTVHCPYGEDEVDCFRIVREKTETPSEVFLSSKKSRSLTSGYLYYRKGGTEWKPACSEDFGSGMEDVVCPYLSLSKPGAKNYKRNAPRYKDRPLPAYQAPPRGRSSDAKESECTQAWVNCGEASCGERRLYTFAPGKALPSCGRPGTHPWLGVVLINGSMSGMATLVSKQWAVASTHALQSHMKLLTQDYVAIKLGQLDLSMPVTSPMEQIKRVNYMQEEDDLVFLHLDKSVQMDHFSVPICTNFGKPTEFQYALLDYCVQITMEGGKFVYTHVKVKAAGEHFAVELNSAGCHVPDEGAFVYCSTDPDVITYWYFVGFLHGAYCSATENGTIELENPFFGQDAGKFQDLIMSLPPSTVPPPSCSGVRCSHGNCVPKSNICDKISHCLDGLDEKHCKASYQIYRAYGEDEYEYSETNGTSHSCPEGHFRCESTYNCVPISTFCDGNDDCGSDDPTDEPGGQCTCRKYLEMVAPNKICDSAGRIDCPDRSDERGCPCGTHSFMCEESYSAISSLDGCIHRNLVCDGVIDCNNGKDESECVALSEKLDHFAKNKTESSYSGYVVLRLRDKWHPYCSHEWSTQLATALCKELGYDKLGQIMVKDLHQIKYPRRKRYGAPGEGTGSGTGNRNLIIWQQEDDILGENSYGMEDYEAYEDCNVAHVTCSA